MAKFLYAANAFMFATQLGLSDKDLRVFLLFCVTVYLQAGFRCSFICEAEITDIKFVKNLNLFKNIRPDVATTI